MPIKSEQQRKFMAMCLHNPEKAKDKCPPKSVAKKFIHGHSRKDETSDMNNQIDHRLALKILFEAALIKQAQEGKLDEGFFGDIGARLTGRPTSSDKIRNVVNQSRMKRAAKKDTGGTQPNVPITSKITSPVQQVKKLRAARQAAQPAANPVTARNLQNTAGSRGRGRYAGLVDRLSNLKAPVGEKQLSDEGQKLVGSKAQDSTDYSRLGLRALFEAVVISSKKKVVTETKRGTARPAGGGTSTDTGGANLHPVVKRAAKRLAPQGNVTRFEGDPTSPAAAKAQRTHSTAMDAALNSSEEGPSPKNLPPATNRPGKKQAETPGGKATNPLDRPTAGKFTPREVAARIAAMRGK